MDFRKLAKLLDILAKLFADFAEWRESYHCDMDLEWKDYIQIHKAWEKRLVDALHETTEAGLNDVAAKLSACLEVVRSDLVDIVESLTTQYDYFKEKLNELHHQIKDWDLENTKGIEDTRSKRLRTQMLEDHKMKIAVAAFELDKVIAALKDLVVLKDLGV
jgi:hypothetical protein